MKQENSHQPLLSHRHTWFEDENPSAVEEEKDSEAKLDRIAECFDVVNVII